MKTYHRLFIASIVNKVFAIAFAFLGSILHDLHKPPFDESGTTAYITAAGFAATSVILGAMGLNMYWDKYEADKKLRDLANQQYSR